MLTRKHTSQGLLKTQARAMGGGEKKPSMPVAERNFDIVFVGKFNHFILYNSNNRWY